MRDYSDHTQYCRRGCWKRAQVVTEACETLRTLASTGADCRMAASIMGCGAVEVVYEAAVKAGCDSSSLSSQHVLAAQTAAKALLQTLESRLRLLTRNIATAATRVGAMQALASWDRSN
jgi:hypothetical protein